MPKEKKKGASGNAKAFISRGKALKKLQLSLPEFRRLCILKGIYPRNPRKKLDGSDKTYYLRKDIDFLAHDRLLPQLRSHNAHSKKVIKARSHKRLDLLKKLSLTAPRSRLDHLIVERYPRFEDALRELDDPLCIISLFANLPASGRIGVSPHRVARCRKLLTEFSQFVTITGCLTKCFVSIKGYYFQARLDSGGEGLTSGNGGGKKVNVTWITPHRFTQHIPTDVDFSVMTTFLELYECMLAFVNFRLYTQRNMAYPPKIDRNMSAGGLELSSLLVRPVDERDNKMEEENEEESGPAKVTNDIVKQAEQIAKDAAGEEEEEEDEEKEEEVDGDEDEEEVDGDDKEKEKNEQDRSGKTDGQKPSSGENVDEEGRKHKTEDEKDPTKGNDGDVIVGEIEDDDIDPSKQRRPIGVFSGKSVILGREVPYIEAEFILKAAGATRVTRENDLPAKSSETKVSSLSEDGYSHWVIDRPAVMGDRDMGLEYVQPQYLFDSVNAGVLLPVSLYTVGRHLPPHLSPFVTVADDGGYRPWYEEVLERIKQGDETVVSEAAAVVYKEGEAIAKKMALGEGDGGDDSDDESDDDDVDDDATMEDGGVRDEDSEGEEEREGMEKVKTTEEEEKEMAALMLSRKKKREYKKVKGGEMKKEAKKRKLEEKRKQIEGEHEQLTKQKRNSKKKRKISTKHIE